MSTFVTRSKSGTGNQILQDRTARNTFNFLRRNFKKELTPSKSSKPEEHVLGIQKPFFQFKIVLLGESAVGKSCLATRFVKEFFNEYEESTVGAAFMSKTLEFPRSTVKLDIWDTAGAEQFHVIAPLYYRKAQGAIMVYDVTNRDSFDRIKFWIKELRTATTATVVVLVGNKNDMYVQRTVDYEEGLRLAKSHEFLFFESSAKTGYGVGTLFETVAKKLTMLDFYDESDDAKDDSNVKSDCGCCKLFRLC